MSARKPYLLSKNHRKTTLFGRALAHDLRVEILTILLTLKDVRCIDLARQFNSSTGNIHHHIQILSDANLIDLKYHTHYYILSIRSKKFALVSNTLSNFD